MLWQPRSWSSIISAAISRPLHSLPSSFWEMSQFWQNAQRRLHRPKKMVPEPRPPRRQSSSPKWGKALDTIAKRPVWQARVSFFKRSHAQFRGQAWQSASSASAASTRAGIPPSRKTRRQAGSKSQSSRRKRRSATTGAIDMRRW